MIVHADLEQGSIQWYEMRAGKVTASEVDALVTPLFKIKVGEGPKTFLYQKLSESFGELAPMFSSWQTEHGQELEDEARKWYAFQFNDKVKQIGFCESDDHRCGCSPDGLIGEDGGLELKAPQGTNHVRYLTEGILPADYAPQVHMSMYVTGRPWWKFVSYHRKFPPFVLRVERDEAIQSAIHEALTAFYARYDAALTKLKAL